MSRSISTLLSTLFFRKGAQAGGLTWPHWDDIIGRVEAAALPFSPPSPSLHVPAAPAMTKPTFLQSLLGHPSQTYAHKHNSLNTHGPLQAPPAFDRSPASSGEYSRSRSPQARPTVRSRACYSIFYPYRCVLCTDAPYQGSPPLEQ